MGTKETQESGFATRFKNKVGAGVSGQISALFSPRRGQPILPSACDGLNRQRVYVPRRPLLSLPSLSLPAPTRRPSAPPRGAALLGTLDSFISPARPAGGESSRDYSSRQPPLPARRRRDDPVVSPLQQRFPAGAAGALGSRGARGRPAGGGLCPG